MKMPSILRRLVRPEVAPSLSNRAASLRSALARVARRGEPGPDRRALIAGSLAAALPLPALAAASTAADHPDRALFAAEAALLAAERAYYVARDAASDANRRCTRDLGPCPVDLIASRPDVADFTFPFGSVEVRRCHTFRWVEVSENADDPMNEAWTAAGLRCAIRYGVAVCGRGGTTPHRIRRWRELLPLADTFDARREVCEVRYRLHEFVRASREAEKAWTVAQVALANMRAATPEGLAVIARYVGRLDRERMPAAWRSLLHSAATVSGIDLPEPHERSLPLRYL